MASLLTGRDRVDFWTLSFGQLLVFVGFFSFFQFPLYIKSLGGGEQTVGLIWGAGTISGAVFLPWITAMVERIDRKTLMLAGLTVLMASTSALAWPAKPDLLMGALMFVRGLGFTLYIMANGTYVAQIVPQKEKSRWIGINFGFNQAAIGVGPLLGGLAIASFGFHRFFFLSTAVVFSGFMLVFLISGRKPLPVDAPFQAWNSLTDFFRNLLSDRFFRSFLTLVLLAGALGAVFTFTALYTQLLGLSTGLFFFSYSVATAGIRFFGSGLADKFGRTLVVTPTMILMSAGLFLYSTIDSTAMMLVSAVMIGIGFGLANPAILAGMLDRATPRLQGMAVAGFHLAYSLGLSISSPVFGAIAENVGYPPMWWISGGLTLCSVAIYAMPLPGAGKLSRISED